MSSSWKPSKPATDQKIWRYIDFPQFYSVLNTGELWFGKNSEFNDSYEGILPKRVQKRLAENMPEPWTGNPGTAMFEIMRFVTFSNCWHMNDRQSMAMWQTYNKSGKEIAIESKAGDLVQSIEEEKEERNIISGKVKYIDYDKISEFPLDNFSPYFHKRKGFEHEREFRVVIQDFDLLPFAEDLEDDGVPIHKILNSISEETPAGINMSAELNELVNRIHVSPVADDWLKSVVEDIVQNSDHISSDTPVKKSKITSEPEHWKL